MRRTVLIVLFVLYHLCAGLWIGATVGIGALAAPQAFRELDRQTAGVLMGHVFERLNTVSLVLLGIMLAVALFETWYRRRTVDRFWLVARLTLTAVALVIVAFMNERLMPDLLRMRAGAEMDAFNAIHKTYRAWSMAGILSGVGAMVASSVINVSARRSGGGRRKD